MELDTEVLEDIAIIRVKGELDAITAPELAEAFKSQLDKGHVNFVFDLENLEYSSSAGIRIFLGSARDSRKNGGDLRIGSVKPQVSKIFNLSKFDKVVKVFRTAQEAINSFSDQK